MNQRPSVRAVIVTGLSGSGKSTALKALEDIGFFCVDNLPVALLPPFLKLRGQSSPEAMKVALGMDMREPGFAGSHPAIFEELERSGYRLEIVFLEASPESLIKRFSETRRAHPLAQGQTIGQAVGEEKEALEHLRRRASLVIDTTALSPHGLKRRIIEVFSGPLTEKRLQVTLMSFGFKYGLPHEADLVMDVRFLPNPFFVESLKPLTGLDREVADWLAKSQEPQRFLERFVDLLSYLFPLYDKEGKAYLTVAVGCTGGRHRSVYMVERLREQLAPAGYDLVTRHRDIDLA